ncbi:MAG: TAXI family TRAP transporter solute-binding subunit [Alphaproteobacteria bacterium]|nr:TAXI family TRAP transporter solute-binding subunit [Alphaproteobacteria bacterium]
MNASEPRRHWLSRIPAIALGLALACGAWGLAAQETGFFRIATGSTGGTYFPIGGLIANAVSSPPGSRACEDGGSCGVPGLIAAAISTTGSVANVEAVAKGTIESGLSQADVAFWAFSGTGIYRKKKPLDDLRAIANLYPESVHLVVRADSGIKSVADLKGKRVAVGEEGSGTLVDAEIILRAYGLSRRNIKASYVKPGPASDLLAEGKLDGMFFVAGAPAGAVQDLARRTEIRLVSIAGDKADALIKRYRFFARGRIDADIYEGVAGAETVTVGAQWVTSAAIEEDLVYALTRSLWHDTTRKLLDRGHPKGKQILLENAIDGVAIPLHPGAARYYSEIGLLSDLPAPESRPAPAE